MVPAPIDGMMAGTLGVTAAMIGTIATATGATTTGAIAVTDETTREPLLGALPLERS
ncbi:hypothetical protein ACMGE0_32685 [Neorhizobium sp. DT-125]